MSETTYDAATEPIELDDRRNRVRVGHLVVGLVFLGLAASWALRAGGVIGDPETAVVVPVVLVVAGIGGLLVAFFGSRLRNPTPAQTYTHTDEENQ